MSETKEDEQPDKDMMNMFASVWVKVEVNSNAEEESDSEDNTQDGGDNVGSKKKKKEAGRTKKNLKCDLCDYTTAYKNCLKLHILGHSDTKPFACDSCGYTTKYPISLQRHVLKHEFKKTVDPSAVPQFKCDQCKYTTYFKWNLNAHKRKHKLEKQFKCDQCTYETAYRHNFLKHSKVHKKDEVVYKCYKCPFITNYEGHLSRHLAQIHNEVSITANKCDFCDFSTKLRWRLNIHKKRSKKKNVLKCNCGFETYYNCEFKKHKKIHYDEIQTGKTNPEISNFEPIPNQSADENQTQEDTKEIESEIPDNDYVSSADSDDDFNKIRSGKYNHYTLDPNCKLDWKHIKVIESKGNHPFQCTSCAYSSRFKASVQRHFQRQHMGDQNKPFKCLKCDFSTKTKDQIALHNKRSKSKIPLYCEECKFGTTFKCRLVMHQKKHYAHQCNECKYSCKSKYDLQKHISTMHLGNGLKCQFCDYKTTRRETLISHEAIHTGNKPFQCKFCDYKAVRKCLLVNHIKRRHSDVHNNPVVLSENNIESMKIPMENEETVSENVNQESREQSFFSIEDILNAHTIVFNQMLNSTQNTNDDQL